MGIGHKNLQARQATMTSNQGCGKAAHGPHGMSATAPYGMRVAKKLMHADLSGQMQARSQLDNAEATGRESQGAQRARFIPTLAYSGAVVLLHSPNRALLGHRILGGVGAGRECPDHTLFPPLLPPPLTDYSGPPSASAEHLGVEAL